MFESRTVRVVLALAIPLLATIAPGQPVAAATADDSELAAGKLLVATRRIDGPSFRRTVVLLIKYGSEGAKGLIVNRRTEVHPAEILPEIKGLKHYKEPIYVGGPVQRELFFLLARLDEPPPGMGHVFGDVYLGQSRELLEELARRRKTRHSFHIYSGYAGWAPGQLESEIERGDWWVASPEIDIVFSDDPPAVWQELTPPVPPDPREVAWRYRVR